jgi:transcriptional regulator ATRX
MFSFVFFPFQDWWNDLLHENNYKVIDYSGKMVLLLDILVMSSNVGDKTLVFSQSIPTLDLIELYLSRLTRHGKKGKFWRKGKDWYRCAYTAVNCFHSRFLCFFMI